MIFFFYQPLFIFASFSQSSVWRKMDDDKCVEAEDWLQEIK